MRTPLLFAIVFLGSCNGGESASNRTVFQSESTGKITRTAGRADEPKLVPYKGMAADAEVLLGDPDAVGSPFVIRVRELPGTIVPPHSHPVDENITIVSGTWHFGFGDTFDAGKLTVLPTGSYAYAPKGSTMFAYAPHGAVVQVHGVGPFHINWRHRAVVLGTTAADEVFRYRRGQRVVTPRGGGVIRQGYANGPLIQYEIDGGPNRLFMAQEPDVKPVSE